MESTSIASYACKVMSYSYQSKKWEFVGEKKETSRVEIVKKPKDNFHRIVGFRESDKIDTIDMEITKKLIVNLSVKTFVTLKGEYSTFGIQFKKENESVDFVNKVTSIKSTIGLEPPTMPSPIEDDNSRKAASPSTPPTAPPITSGQVNNSQGAVNKPTFQPTKSEFVSIKQNAADFMTPDSTDHSGGSQTYKETLTDFGSTAPSSSMDQYTPSVPPPPPPAAAPPPPLVSNDTPTPVESGGDSLSSALAGIKLRKTTTGNNSTTSSNVRANNQMNAVEKPTPAPPSGGNDMMSEMQMKLLKRKNKEEADAKASTEAESPSAGVYSINPPATTISIKAQNSSSPPTRHHTPNSYSLRPPPKAAAANGNQNKINGDSKSNLSPEMSMLKEEIMRDIRKELEIMKKEIIGALNK